MIVEHVFFLSLERILIFLSSDEVAFHRDQALHFIVEISGLRTWNDLLFASVLEESHPSKPQGGSQMNRPFGGGFEANSGIFVLIYFHLSSLI